MGEISLLIQNQSFRVKKQVLCEHSDYFRAMFSGKYAEEDQQEITIDVVDATSMNIILRYMELGLIDLTEYDLTTIGDLAVAANFLQITELIKQIEYCLDIQLSLSNWIETMTIAENSSYSKLEQLCASFGLFSFKYMKPEYIPSIHKLFWYLSHPYLGAETELQVFNFGLQWVSHTETGADALVIILGCLDLNRIVRNELEQMKVLVNDYVNSLGAKVIDCLLEITRTGKISVSAITKNKNSLIEMFTERVFNEALSLVRESKCRKLTYTAAVPMWLMKDSKLEMVPHHMYTFNEEKGFEKWLEVAEQNLWGWNVTSWGPMKLVVVCGEYGRGTGFFMKDVKVYDTLRKEWVSHGVQLPSRRHAGVTTLGESMFIIGGVGGFRVVLDTAVIYDLKQKSFRKIANLPDAIQNPAVCTHRNKVYAAGHKNIYQYEDTGETDRWTTVAATDMRINSMVSYKNYIYCTQNYFSHLYRFKPGVDKKLTLVTYFTNPPTSVCNLGDRLLFFTRTLCAQTELIVDMLSIEEFKDAGADEVPKVIWSQSEVPFRVNDVAGSCSLVMTMPPVATELSSYHQRYLMRYSNPIN